MTTLTFSTVSKIDFSSYASPPTCFLSNSFINPCTVSDAFKRWFIFSYSKSSNIIILCGIVINYGMCVCVFTGLRTVQYDRIMRWWISNLGQVLLQS